MDQDEIDWLWSLTPAKALRERFELEAELTNTPSPTGLQLDAVENRILGPGHNGGGRDVLHAKRVRLMDHLVLMRDLNRQEVEVCRLRYHDLLRTVSYERTVRIPDLRDGEGEEVLSRVLRPDGTPDQNWVRVRGLRQRLPTYREVAEHMAQRGELTADGQPMTAGAVERRLRDACAKVAWAIRARAAMAELEERA